MAHYVLNNDGSITKQKKKKNIVENAVDVGKAIFNLPKTIAKGTFNAGKQAVDEVLEDGYQAGDISKVGLKTIGNTATNVVHGAGKSLENFYDFSLNASSNVNTRLNEMTGIQTKREAEIERKNAQSIIKKDLTTELENKIGWNDDLRNEWEKGSLVKRDNLGGKIAQGVGEMIPQILIGNKLGGNEAQWKALNFGQKLVASSPTNLGIGITSYGGGLEEAYSEGATTSQANKYALGSALIEMGTEWLTDGVPGLPQTGVFDKFTDKALDKTSNSMAKFLLKQGFTFLGEGGEEALSEMIKPYLQNATYTSGRKINWNDVFESFVIGGLVGDILELPGNLSNYKMDVNKLKEQFINENSSFNLPNSNENTQSNINLPSVDSTSQNGLKLPTTVSQNATVNTNINPTENLQEFAQQREEKRAKQVQEETNTRLENIENQLSKIQGLEHYSENEIKDNIYRYIQEKLEENGIDPRDINIVASDIHGSRKRGTAKVDSDLDVVFQYKGDLREDDLFNILNDNGDNNLYIDGIKVDLNPIQEDLKSYMDRSIKYDNEILNKKGTLNEALERQAENIMKNQVAMIDYFEDYMQENGITKPTYQDIVNSLDSYDVYDSEGGFSQDTEQKYYNTISQYYDIPNIPGTASNKTVLPTVEKNSDMVYNEGTGRRYNSIQEAIDVDPRKATFAKYNTSVDFFNLDYNEMKKAIAIGSKYAMEAQRLGFDNYTFNDENYNYDFDIINKENNAFGITHMEAIDDSVRRDVNERIEKQNNGLSDESASYEKRYNDSNFESIKNGESSEKITKLPTRKSEQRTTNESRQSVEGKKNNSRGELENSSFSLPTKENNKTSMPMAKTDDVLRIASKNIAKQINGAGGFDLKQRSWVETATESDVLRDKVYIEDLDKGMINYVVQSNKKSLDSANNHLNTYGYDKSLEYVKNIMQSDKLPSASDVALMQRMIQEASKRGDYETVQELVMDTAIVGTDLGQATQALSIIQRLTPEGQLKMYTKLVQRAKARGEKSFQNVEITPEMVQNILEAYDANGTYDQNDLNARVEQFKQDIADQMKSTVGEKIDSWRYLAMLGNPKTHIRNMVSNIAMTGTIKVKNAMARTLESILPVQNRTKTWKKASNDIREFSKQTANDMKGIITGENKYNEKSAIESKKQIFKNKALEKLSTLNGNALEGEDWFFSKRAFQSTLQEYLTANGMNTYEDIENNPELVEKAKLYAVEQAEIATFRQYSQLAATINQIERKNKGAKLAVQALMPFKKTPINVAKAGINYSPVGLIKNISYDLYQLKQGNIEASQFIDKLSQGLTGTSLTLLGYALAKSGILTGSGGDDKDDKYDKQLGNTGYSLNIGGNSYSISWLSPVAMPLLVGSNAYEQLEEEKDWDMNVVSDTLAKTLDPLNEMSFMQGLTNALQSYGSGTDKIKGALESTGQNYVGQFFPTLFSQFASTIDDKKRSTKASNNSKYKFGEQTVRSIMYKLPGLRQQLEVATDIWGNEKEQSSNILERAFESFLAPYSKTKDISTDLDKEIKRVYNETGENGVIPSIPYAYVKYKGETYRMSANEYTQYKKTYGQKANKYLNELIKSSSYKNANDDMKAKMMDKIYDYAKAEANEEYFKKTSVDYTSDTLKELNSLRKLNINNTTLAEYVSNKTQVSSIRSSSNYTNEEKKQKVSEILTNSNLENKQLSYLYGKYYSTEEKLNAISSVNIPIKEFIKYDLTDFKSDYNSKTGKAISGSREKKIINYVNSLHMSVAQKALLIKLEYNSYKKYDSQIVNYVKSSSADYLDKAYLLKQSGFNNYDNDIINYVKKHYKTAKEREEILKNLGFTVRNGRVYK